MMMMTLIRCNLAIKNEKAIIFHIDHIKHQKMIDVHLPLVVLVESLGFDTRELLLNRVRTLNRVGFANGKGTRTVILASGADANGRVVVVMKTSALPGSRRAISRISKVKLKFSESGLLFEFT